MSTLALVAVAGLALWLFASLGFALGLGWVRRIVAPSNRFRVFGAWAMFAAGEGRKGAYGLAYRDTAFPAAPGLWTTLATGHHWSWHVCLLDPRRSLADAVHTLGRELHRLLQQAGTPEALTEIAFAQTRLRDHVRHLAPLAPGVRREIRVVKHLAAGDQPEWVVICEFTGESDAGH